MKKFSILFLLMIAGLLPLQSFTQDSIIQHPKHEREPNRIKSGFYIKIGPSFPLDKFKTGDSVSVEFPNSKKSTGTTKKTVIFYPAKMGFAMDLGFLIYLGPAFAGNHLRAGIDASFVSFTYNPATNLPDSILTNHSKSNYWYYYLGQKFGPVFSICPVDRLVIDLSFKLNAYAAYVQHPRGHEFKTDFGKNLTQYEISMNIRYSLILFSFQYNYGKTGYNNFNSDNPMVYAENNTFRILVGFKF